MSDWIYTNNSFTKNDLKLNYSNSIYEVIRVVKGIPLFIEDHYNRWQHSAKDLSITIPISISKLIAIIHDLVTKNDIKFGNIKLELQLLDNYQNNLWIGFVPHSYPSVELYKYGVNLVSYQVERKNPQIKQSVVNDAIRQEIAVLKNLPNVYEVLLINHKNQVTEGSRSNIFFVKDADLISCPSTQILEGITRKKVLEIGENSNYNYLEQDIDYDQIAEFEACFLTGTSPKVLPVAKIDNIIYSIENKVTDYFINQYNSLIEDYCKQFR